jgi:hypothetical protein
VQSGASNWYADLPCDLRDALKDELALVEWQTRDQGADRQRPTRERFMGIVISETNVLICRSRSSRRLSASTVTVSIVASPDLAAGCCSDNLTRDLTLRVQDAKSAPK